MAKRKPARRASPSASESGLDAAGDMAPVVALPGVDDKRAKAIAGQLAALEVNSRGKPIEADADILFAYGVMQRHDVMPLDVPSVGAWNWYVYARVEPARFLEIFAKREDAKTKAAGTITQQRIEDDRRRQFTMLDRVERQLTIDVAAIINDLMQRFPEDVLLACRKHARQWNDFLAKYPPA